MVEGAIYPVRRHSIGFEMCFYLSPSRNWEHPKMGRAFSIEPNAHDTTAAALLELRLTSSDVYRSLFPSHYGYAMRIA
jgi:hypothetical protein